MRTLSKVAPLGEKEQKERKSIASPPDCAVQSTLFPGLQTTILVSCFSYQKAQTVWTFSLQFYVLRVYDPVIFLIFWSLRKISYSISSIHSPHCLPPIPSQVRLQCPRHYQPHIWLLTTQYRSKSTSELLPTYLVLLWRTPDQPKEGLIVDGHSRYEGLPPNYSLSHNMMAGAFAGIAVRSLNELGCGIQRADRSAIGTFCHVPCGSLEGMDCNSKHLSQCRDTNALSDQNASHKSWGRRSLHWSHECGLHHISIGRLPDSVERRVGCDSGGWYGVLTSAILKISC